MAIRLRAALQTQPPVHEGFAEGPGHTFFTATGGRASIDPTIGIVPSDFELVPSPGSVTVPRGQPANYTISAMPSSGSFDAAVDLTCGSLPANATCAFTPPRVVPGSTGADVRLTINTARASSAGSLAGLTTLAFAGVLASGTFVRRARVGWRRLNLALRIGWLIAAAACGGGSGSNPAPPSSSTTTPPGTYSVVVTGSSGAVQRNVTLTLTVQ